MEGLSSAPGGCPPRVPPPRSPPLPEAVRSIWRPGTHVAGLGGGGQEAPCSLGRSPPPPPQATSPWDPMWPGAGGLGSVGPESHTGGGPGRQSRVRAPGNAAGTQDCEGGRSPVPSPKPAAELQREHRSLSVGHPPPPVRAQHGGPTLAQLAPASPSRPPTCRLAPEWPPPQHTLWLPVRGPPAPDR